MKLFKHKIITGKGWKQNRDVVCAELDLQCRSGWELVAVDGDDFILRKEVERKIREMIGSTPENPKYEYYYPDEPEQT